MLLLYSNFEDKIVFSSSDLLRCSKDIVIKCREVIQPSGETTIWNAYFSLYIFGNEPFMCSKHLGFGFENEEEAKKSESYFDFEYEHSLIIRVLSNKK